MKKIFFLFAITILSVNFFAQTKHAITVDDLWNMKRIGSFDVSPDGNKIVFDVSSYSMDENTGNTDIRLINSDGTSLKVILDKGKNVSSPQFVNNGKSISYLSNGQLSFADLNGKNTLEIPEFYSGIGAYEFSIDGNNILFSS